MREQFCTKCKLITEVVESCSRCDKAAYLRGLGDAYKKNRSMSKALDEEYRRGLEDAANKFLEVCAVILHNKDYEKVKAKILESNKKD